MEQLSQDRIDDQQDRPLTEGGARTGDLDVRTEIMNREKRDEALAWVQAYRLIRGGVVDEVVEFIEGSQYTIELLVQMLRDAACRGCDTHEPADPCDFCRRRDALLAELG